MPITLGLDFGTTSISAAAVDGQGRLFANGTRAHKADVGGLPAGRAEQSPRKLFETALDLLADVSQRLPEPPAALGLTGQMHGLLLVDATLAPVTNLITWQDKRSLEAGPDGTTALDRFRAACEPEAVLRTGCTPSPGYLGVTLYTLQDRSEIPPTAMQALIFADWAASRLSGSKPVIDRTNAASTGVFDLERDRWSELIEQVGLPRSLFPNVVESGTIVGGLTAEFAKATGLPAGLPVASAIGDHQAAVLGSLPAGEAAVQVNIGTGGQVSLPIGRFVRTPKSDARYLPDGRYLLVGAGLAGGDAYAWVQRTVANWLAAFGCERPDAELFETLAKLASAIPPGADGLCCEPFFRGTRREPARRAVFGEIDTDNFTPGHVARAVLEGIAEALAGFVRDHAAVDEVPNRRTRVIATGNAVRRNPLLASSLANRFGLPLYVPEHEEEAAYGAAILAGVRVGVWESLEEAGRRFRLVKFAG